MSALAEELALYAATKTPYHSDPYGRTVLRDLLERCPSLAALLEREGAGPEALDPEWRKSARWTEADDRALSEMYWSGETLGAMAGAMGRTEAATAQRLCKLGIPMSERKGKR